MADLPNVDVVRSLLSYDLSTGDLRWLSSRCGVRAGKIAGTDHKGYLRIRILGKLVLAHRVAWAIHYGEWPNSDLDHIDRNKRNNKISNLRLVDRSQSCVNRAYPVGVSGIRGVSAHKQGWQAAISMYGKTHYIGIFKTKEEAEAARKGAETALHKDFTPLKGNSDE